MRVREPQSPTLELIALPPSTARRRRRFKIPLLPFRAAEFQLTNEILKRWGRKWKKGRASSSSGGREEKEDECCSA